MTLLIICGLVFLATAGLTVSGFHFFVEVPAAKRQMRVRLASIRESEFGPGNSTAETQIVRSEMLSSVPAFNRMLLNAPWISKVQLFLTQAGVQTPVGTVMSLSASLGMLAAVAVFLLRLPLISGAAAAAAAAAIPFAVIAVKRRRRLRKFEELFPDAIDLLARAVRAGHAFTTGFSLIADEMPEPVSSEFRATFDQQNLGMPIVDALRNLSIRVPLPDVRIFLAALTIQKDSGGNLGEILDNLSAVVRERFKILRQVQVFTAEGRLSLYMLTAMPPIAGLVMYSTNPDYMMRLLEDPLGHQALAAAVIMQVVGYIVIRKIIRIKV